MRTKSEKMFWNATATSALTLLLTATFALGSDSHPASPTKRDCCSEIPTAAPLSDRSIYQLGSVWTNDAGRTVKLSQLRGKPHVVAMIYTSCAGACPMLVYQMQQIAKSLPAAVGTNVGFLLVTFDPEHDTPATLQAYRTTRHLEENRWTLLHGRAEDVRELALVLGVKYRQDERGQFSHSNVITLLNAEGEIAFQQTGLGGSSEELTRQLTHLFKP